MDHRVQALLRKVAHDPGDAQITSHCPFCGSGQIVGRSDGNIECEFCGMAYLVRVQPMFTGMPGNPMGGGFGGDSSMAPDLMAPEMLGPDGAPMMGEPGMEETPGMEMQDAAMMMGGGPDVPGGPGALGEEPGEDEGDGEPGEVEEDGDGGPPGAPPEGDSDGGDGEDGKKKPVADKGGDQGKSKKKKDKSKKEGALLYTTIAGDRLPEDAFIRHLAVLHGGVEVVRRAS